MNRTRAERGSAGRRTREVLARIEAEDRGAGGLHAYLAVDGSAAERADALDRALAAGREAGRLAGALVAVKDNICTRSLPTTCGSRMLDGYRSPYDATAVRRLRAAGAIVLGKTNLDEFAMGSSTENSAFGPTLNPHDRERVPGGSSGGSAAAVAAGLADFALGSDTGGSVRQPAAFCGVVGLKPTWGRVSRYGLVAFASSLDQIGVFARSVAAAAEVLETIAGPDPLDATAARHEVPPLARAAAAGASGLVIGVPEEYLGAELDSGVRGRFDAAVEAMRGAGAEVRPVSLPNTRLAIPAYYLIAPAEASSNLARFDGVRYGARASSAATTGALYREARSRGFGDEVKRRIVLGTYALSAGYHDRYYGRAQQARRLIAGDFRRVFGAGVDVLFTPTTPTPAFRLGERIADPYAMYSADVYTVTANLAGVPAVSVPIGRADGLPVGGQFLAGPWAEAALVRAAGALERALAEA